MQMLLHLPTPPPPALSLVAVIAMHSPSYPGVRCRLFSCLLIHPLALSSRRRSPLKNTQLQLLFMLSLVTRNERKVILHREIEIKS